MTRFKKVLIAVDLEEEAAAYVIDSAKRLVGTDALELLHVQERSHFFNVGDPAFALLDDMHLTARRELDNYMAKLGQRGGIKSFSVLEGHAATLIQQYAHDNGHDLIAMGTHGRHGLKRILGSTANAVLQGTAASVLAIRVPDKSVTPIPAANKYQQILAAVDLSDETEQVLNDACAIAQAQGAKLGIVHVIKPFAHAYAGVNPSTLSDVGIQFEREAEEQATTQLAAIAKARHLDESLVVVRHGTPAMEIHSELVDQRSDLLIIGTHGKHGVKLLLGSTANAVLHGATGDVLAIRIR